MDASLMPVPSHYPNPYSPPPVPPVLHKVWILDCRACNMFLTNRGMKVALIPSFFSLFFNYFLQAVLLLRPNVSLFSSDTLPVNCSAYNANPDVLRSTSTHNPNPSSRTCECLTQSLCCHGCGNAIGYMIVVPVRPSFLAYCLSYTDLCPVYSVHIFYNRDESSHKWPSLRLSPK
jgi:hypothetical protein